MDAMRMPRGAANQWLPFYLLVLVVSASVPVVHAGTPPIIVDPLKASGRQDFLATGMDGQPFYYTWSPTRSFTSPDGPYYPPPSAQVRLTNNAVGVGGNQPIATSDPAMIVISGMSGGNSTTAATGWIALGGQNPADGDTVTINDGTTSCIFEFDSNSSVTPGNASVVIGLSSNETLGALVSAIGSCGLNVSASLDQASGYRITVASSPPDAGNPSLPQDPPTSYSASPKTSAM